MLVNSRSYRGNKSELMFELKYFSHNFLTGVEIKDEHFKRIRTAILNKERGSTHFANCNYSGACTEHTHSCFHLARVCHWISRLVTGSSAGKLPELCDRRPLLLQNIDRGHRALLILNVIESAGGSDLLSHTHTHVYDASSTKLRNAV